MLSEQQPAQPAGHTHCTRLLWGVAGAWLTTAASGSGLGSALAEQRQRTGVQPRCAHWACLPGREPDSGGPLRGPSLENAQSQDSAQSQFRFPGAPTCSRKTMQTLNPLGPLGVKPEVGCLIPALPCRGRTPSCSWLCLYPGGGGTSPLAQGQLEGRPLPGCLPTPPTPAPPARQLTPSTPATCPGSAFCPTHTTSKESLLTSQPLPLGRDRVCLSFLSLCPCTSALSLSLSLSLRHASVLKGSNDRRN